jgi:hypothetical protein
MAASTVRNRLVLLTSTADIRRAARTPTLGGAMADTLATERENCDGTGGSQSTPPPSLTRGVTPSLLKEGLACPPLRTTAIALLQGLFGFDGGDRVRRHAPWGAQTRSVSRRSLWDAPC